jgi:sphinganine-1-phosphate aldolase
MYHGTEGYIRSCQRIVGTARAIVAAVKGMPGIRVIGEPITSVVAFESDEVDIYRISDGLSKKGWNINNLQYPPAFHICCTYLTDADQFITDLQDVLAVVLENPSEKASYVTFAFWY